MADIQPTEAPRKLPLVKILVGFILLLIALFLYQLFGASSRIVVSKETTFITEPLDENGLPNIAAHILQQDSQGVTPENNAAVLIWQATWPGELDQEYWIPMTNALGMEEVPSTLNTLVRVYNNIIREQVAADLTEHYSKDLSPEAVDRLLSETWQSNLRDDYADQAIDEARTHPWTSEQLPSLALWAESNQQPLDLLVEAAARPKYFSPSPSFVNGENESLLHMLLPGVQGMRAVQRALLVRAMWHLGEERMELAWTDIHTCFRLARHLSHGRTLVEQLVGNAMNSMACQATASLLEQNLSEQLTVQILTDLQALPRVTNMADSLDRGERLFFVDIIMRMAQGKMNEDLIGSSKNSFGVFSLFAFDWNSILREGNQWYDRLVKLTKLPTHSERKKEFELFQNDVQQLSSNAITPRSIIGSAISRGTRSHTLASILLSLILPAQEAAMKAEDRGITHQQLTITAAALKLYHIQNNQYPESLDQLVPAILPQLPIDLYTEQPLIYQRKEEGYLLYSVSENLIDDAGTNRDGTIINGEWTNELPEVFDSEAVDEVIRTPQPKFKFPELPLEELEN